MRRPRHDSFLKRLYRAGFRDALTLFFPDLASHIDWDHWQWIDKEIPILGRRRGSVIADLVGETRDREGRYLQVLVHPELQMRPDEEMDWWVFEYNTGLLLQEGQPRTRVLTFAFYHCAGTGGIQERQFVLDFYEKSLHTLTYWTVGLGELEAESYSERDNPMGWALTSWMRQPRERRVELRLQVLERILRWVRNEEYQGLLFDAVQTYYKLSRAERNTEERLLERGGHGEVREMAQTVLERREAYGLQRAVKRAILTRFPEAPTAITDRVDRIAAADRLEELISRVIEARDLAEIEAWLAS